MYCLFILEIWDTLSNIPIIIFINTNFPPSIAILSLHFKTLCVKNLHKLCQNTINTLYCVFFNTSLFRVSVTNTHTHIHCYRSSFTVCYITRWDGHWCDSCRAGVNAASVWKFGWI